MPTLNTKDLTDSALDYAVALAEGYVWAQNASHRMGGDKDWPIGALNFIAPRFAKDLDDSKPNWNGWIKPVNGAPLSPRAFHGMPHYSNYWAEAGPIIDREFICINGDDGTPDAPPSWDASIFDDGEYTGSGPTALIAAMRCYVASKLGDTVDIPAELLQ